MICNPCFITVYSSEKCEHGKIKVCFSQQVLFPISLLVSERNFVDSFTDEPVTSWNTMMDVPWLSHLIIFIMVCFVRVIRSLLDSNSHTSWNRLFYKKNFKRNFVQNMNMNQSVMISLHRKISMLTVNHQPPSVETLTQIPNHCSPPLIHSSVFPTCGTNFHILLNLILPSSSSR